MHEDIRKALQVLKRQFEARERTILEGPVIRSERGGYMSPQSRRELVPQPLRLAGSRRLLLSFWAEDLHHHSRQDGPQGWRLST